MDRVREVAPLSTAKQPDRLAEKQFTIAGSRLPLEHGFKDVSFGPLFIHVHMHWGVAKIVNSDGRQVGVFIGEVIDPSKKVMIAEQLTWSSSPGTADFDLKASFEKFIYHFSGTWACIVDLPGLRAIYLDAGGTMPVVFHGERRVAASSSSLIYSSAEMATFAVSVPKGFLDRDKFFPAGLTAHHGIERLLVNFRLNLDSWMQERIWAPDERHQDPDPLFNKIIQRASGTIEALINNGSTAMSLSAGRETRMLMGFCRSHVSRVTSYTMKFPGQFIDVATASKLAQRHGLKHSICKPLARSKPDREIWLKRTGYCVGGLVSYFSIEAPHLPKYALSGLYGEVGRGFLYVSTDKPDDSLSAQDILKRLNLPLEDTFIAAVTRWLGTLPPMDAFTKLDLAYLELRMGGWATPKFPGRETSTIHIPPMADREVLAAFFSLPHETRKNHDLCPSVIRKCWPELLDIPINKGTRLQNFQETIATMTIGNRLINKLRKEGRRLTRMMAR
jgi:hypothetical protein